MVGLTARDEAHAVSLAKQYLSHFRGSVDEWEAPDPRPAGHVVPENRLRAYDLDRAIESVVDVGSVLELRPDYGVGVVTALVRVEDSWSARTRRSTARSGGSADCSCMVRG